MAPPGSSEYARLRSEGVRIVTPIETESWGERYVQMVDPNGVVYQFVQWTADTGAGEAASLQSS